MKNNENFNSKYDPLELLLKELLGSNPERQNMLFKSQRPGDDDFGYSRDNPIMTENIPSGYAYLNRLTTAEGYPLTYNRLGSSCIEELGGAHNVMVDTYQLYLDGKEYAKIYVCPYGHDSEYVPKGLALRK